MSNLETLVKRTRKFENEFNQSELPVIPKYRTVILTCADARVEPAHIFDLKLGDSVVVRNNGGRVTKSIIEEISTLSFMVGMMDESEGKLGTFEVIILHHTHCGAERFADKDFQKALKNKTGIDVASSAIYQHEESLKDDIHRLRDAKEVPDHIIVSGCLYDVKTGETKIVYRPNSLKALRSSKNISQSF